MCVRRDRRHVRAACRASADGSRTCTRRPRPARRTPRGELPREHRMAHELLRSGRKHAGPPAHDPPGVRNAGETIALGSSAVGGRERRHHRVRSRRRHRPERASRSRRSRPAATASSAPTNARRADIAAQGQITSRALELAGPQAVTGGGNPGGYVPCHYTAPATGIYSRRLLRTERRRRRHRRRHARRHQPRRREQLQRVATRDGRGVGRDGPRQRHLDHRYRRSRLHDCAGRVDGGERSSAQHHVLRHDARRIRLPGADPRPRPERIRALREPAGLPRRRRHRSARPRRARHDELESAHRPRGQRRVRAAAVSDLVHPARVRHARRAGHPHHRGRAGDQRAVVLRQRRAATRRCSAMAARSTSRARRTASRRSSSAATAPTSIPEIRSTACSARQDRGRADDRRGTARTTVGNDFPIGAGYKFRARLHAGEYHFPLARHRELDAGRTHDHVAEPARRHLSVRQRVVHDRVLRRPRLPHEWRRRARTSARRARRCAD